MITDLAFTGWIIPAAIAVAALSGLRLWRTAQREELQRLRLEAFRGTAHTAHTAHTETRNAPTWYRQIGSMIAASPIVGIVEQQRLQKLLLAAGIKGRGTLAGFLAIKILSVIILVALAWGFIEWRHLLANTMYYRFAVFGIALLLGWRLPDFILNHLVKRRRLRLEYGIPDALDLLVVCAESGLSLNQSIEEVSRQLVLSNKDVADEFSTTSAEMRIFADFGQAMDNMVERTGLADLRSLTATLKQSLKFGTPLAESMRMIAGEMRATRHARIEERAARLPVLLAIPMVLFILPCMFIVIGTPAVLRIMDVFKNITIGTP
jgi:tight adherence protein C